MSRCLLIPLVCLLGCPTPEKDTGGDSAPVGLPDVDGDGFDAEADCNDTNKAIRPDADELCDGMDNDCDGVIDDEAAPASLPVDIVTWYADSDGDGYGDATAHRTSCEQPLGYIADATDCNDASAAYHPGAPETACAGPDYNCNDVFDEGDADGDGYLACDDCDDTRTSVYPAAAEACDGLDNDCNGTIDDGAGDSVTFYADLDGDRYGDVNNPIEACVVPPGYSETKNDCDDTLATVHPGADEYCNGDDDDCDGEEDEADAVDPSTFYLDQDGDGYGTATVITAACDLPAGYAEDNTDCNDDASTIHPGATEYCGGTDYDCDTLTNEATSADVSPYYSDTDADGYYGTYVASACSAPVGHSFSSTDCDDSTSSVNPGAEDVCDVVDNDCDGDVDDGLRVPSDYSSIQRAINAAAYSGDHVCVEAGTYYENIDFGGRSLSVEGVDGSASTVIQGTGSGSVVLLDSGEYDMRLAGFTIQGGYDDYGAGVYAPYVDGELEDLEITGNGCSGSSYCQGAGLYAYGYGDLTITDVSSTYNYAYPYAASSSGYAMAYGTGAYLGGSATISGLTVSDNYVYTSSVASGAYAYVYGTGIYASSFTGTMDDVTVTGNYVYDGSGSTDYVYVYGNGVSLQYGSGVVEGLTVQANYVYGYGNYVYVWGGGVYLYGDATSFERLDVRGNSNDAVSVYGGALYVSGYSSYPGEPTITNALIAGNKSSWSGSGYNYGNGAGVYVGYYSYPYFYNVDIYANKSTAEYVYGGGFYFESTYSGAYGVNVAVCSNTASYSVGGGGGAMYVGGTSSSYGQDFSYSNFYSNSSTEFSGISTLVGSKGNVAVAPGYTNTSGSTASSWSLKLSGSSSMVNAGDPAIYDADGSRSDIGGYGGPAGSW